MAPNAKAKESLKTGSRSFHFASLMLSQTVSERAARLYRFCRHVDDLVDLATDHAVAKRKINALIASLENNQGVDELSLDAINLFRECGIPRWIPIELIKGVQSDFDQVQIQTETDLIRYCFQVAGTVGLMMCHILGVRSEEARRHAVDLGIAMQLTNIMRDVREDAHLGRQYLPCTWVNGLTTTDFLSQDPAVAEQVAIGLRRMHVLSETYYLSGFQGLPFIPLRSRFGILIAGRIYRSIGCLIKTQAYDYRNPRAVVSSSRKLGIAACQFILAPLSIPFWLPPRQHENRLHQALSIYPISTSPSYKV